MRVVQIIDSLETGGAERMAVNFANALSDVIEFSGLITTRKEGLLLHQLNKKVPYLFLNKKKRIDLKAVFELRKFIKKNRIQLVHAHSSSFFMAVLVKFTFPKIKIIWHDHYGPRIKQSKKQNRILVFFSSFFQAIFSVNKELEEWSIENLKCKNVVFIPNFTSDNQKENRETILKGEKDRRIVFLANLKNPKNHIIVLKAFLKLKLFEDNWSLHLIGKDYLDNYSKQLKDFTNQNELENCIYFYGTKSDIGFILSQASIGILASTFEGFPVTLIEYGFAGLPVISTNVGHCSEIIQNKKNGLLFDPESETELLSQLKKITNNKSPHLEFGENLKNTIKQNYTENKVIEKILLEYNKIL